MRQLSLLVFAQFALIGRLFYGLMASVTLTKHILSFDLLERLSLVELDPLYEWLVDSS